MKFIEKRNAAITAGILYHTRWPRMCVNSGLGSAGSCNWIVLPRSDKKRKILTSGLQTEWDFQQKQQSQHGGFLGEAAELSLELRDWSHNSLSEGTISH